jgi:hypothetical protein
MVQRWMKRMMAALAVLTLTGGLTYAQQKPAAQKHDYSAMQAQGTKAGKNATPDDVSAAMSEEMSAEPKGKEDEIAIFCPTMKTGQLCSHGTMNILQLKGAQGDQWLALARKYNKAVDTATLELFKDAEGTLSKEQLELLKAWFAVGLNPQINELLYSKGLGPKK